ncbi:MAG: hypothetical protein KatS3mg019_1116 [Fimbriimonadales bacterium]|nr:MAG: hypothetical protein KatS3mg019_1116 [Fimbriimonadales bacterium]
MPIIDTVEQLAEFLEQNDEWRRRLFAILVPRSLQRMPEELNEFREETRAEFKAVRQEMREGFERVDREFEKVRQEMHERFERVEREMREGFERVEREMREGFERQGAQIKRNTDDIAELKGLSLEEKFRNQARSWFSRYLKKVRIIAATDVEEMLPEDQPLTEQESEALSNTDLLVFGIDKRDGRECIYAVEVSWVVDSNDVARAVQRARILAQHGLPAAAVAAGREITEGAREQASQLGCGLWINGRFEASPSVL